MKESPEALAEIILAGRDDHGMAANALLEALQRGAPLPILRPLIESDRVAVRAAAAWILLVLGAPAEFADVIEPMRQETDPYLRYAAGELAILRARGVEPAVPRWVRESPEALAETILAGSDDDGSATHALLEALFRGAPTSILRPLIESDQVEVRTAAAWILVELAAPAEFDDVIEPLLQDPDSYMRYKAIELAILRARAVEPAVLGAAIAKLDDPDVRVAARAMQLLVVVDREALGRAAKSSGRAETVRLATLVAKEEGTSPGDPGLDPAVNDRLRAIVWRRAKRPPREFVSGSRPEDPVTLAFLEAEDPPPFEG